jgi:hypothetical protein
VHAQFVSRFTDNNLSGEQLARAYLRLSRSQAVHGEAAPDEAALQAPLAHVPDGAAFDVVCDLLAMRPWTLLMSHFTATFAITIIYSRIDGIPHNQVAGVNGTCRDTTPQILDVLLQRRIQSTA